MLACGLRSRWAHVPCNYFKRELIALFCSFSKRDSTPCRSGLCLTPTYSRRLRHSQDANTHSTSSQSPPNICLFFLWLKKNPLRFIITDLHSNSVHIKQLLQRVGGLMNAAVSSVLTQFFLIHIQSCAPSQLPHDPPPLPSGTAILFPQKCFLQPLPKSQNPLH